MIAQLLVGQLVEVDRLAALVGEVGSVLVEERLVQVAAHAPGRSCSPGTSARNSPAGSPKVRLPPVDPCVNWSRYWMSRLCRSTDPVIGRSNRNGSVNATW